MPSTAFSSMAAKPRAVVVGAGVIGLSVALRLLDEGYIVYVVDCQEEAAASAAAAGMLMPNSVGRASGEAGRVNFAALDLWPRFEERLLSENDEEAEPQLPLTENRGMLLLCRSAEDEKILDCWREGAREDLQLEPLEQQKGAELIAPEAKEEIRSCIFLPEAKSIDPRKLLATLRRQCQEKNAMFFTDRATDIRQSGGRAHRLVCTHREISADVIVAASGAFDLSWIPAPLRPDLVSVQGEALRVATDLFDRAPVFVSSEGALVPRGHGEVWMGVSVREDEDGRPLLAAVSDILQAKRNLFPDLRDARVIEVFAGRRPMSRDGLPFVGATDLPGLLLALGSGRDGILQSPLVAETILECVKGEPERFPSLSPRRVAPMQPV